MAAHLLASLYELDGNLLLWNSRFVQGELCTPSQSCQQWQGWYRAEWPITQQATVLQHKDTDAVLSPTKPKVPLFKSLICSAHTHISVSRILSASELIQAIRLSLPSSCDFFPMLSRFPGLGTPETRHWAGQVSKYLLILDVLAQTLHAGHQPKLGRWLDTCPSFFDQADCQRLSCQTLILSCSLQQGRGPSSAKARSHCCSTRSRKTAHKLPGI